MFTSPLARLTFIGLLSFAASCGSNHSNRKENSTQDTMTNKTPSVTLQKYGNADGKEIMQYTLTNSAGMTVKLINYGATITNIVVPDSTGNMGDVVLGFDSIEGYLQKENPYFGCVTGRYANRIAKGKISIDGKAYQLPINNNGNTLHGGVKGFNKRIWTGEILPGDSSIKFSYVSKDREEGFPGNCSVEVTYSLSQNNELKIEYKATTDQPTAVNITNHSYFNLSAGRDSTILGHEIFINADKYIPVNNELIPTGELLPVKGTAMDFTIPATIGSDIDKVAGGYDHTYVLNKKPHGAPELAVAVHDPASGRYMEVFTTEPGVQFYSGNFLDGTLTGKKGMKYVKHGGLALEAQHFPDSPNQPTFPNTILRPGETFNQTTIYRFSLKG
ncbi:MAG TPA: aldose epimerase family protein [Flavitalea sp.]|nr:aldose epimerase family protein [Flavitalea sp.]